MATNTNASKKVNRLMTVHVVFDSNLLTNLSPSELVRRDTQAVIQASYQDLKVMWYVPSVVRHEREYQMRVKASELLPSIQKLERLLGHPLNIDGSLVQRRVNEAVNNQLAVLGIVELPLETDQVDWDRLVMDAVYRLPPFESGEKEKGFRDALIVESFLQLVAQFPASPRTCRLLLVTGDGLLKKAVEERVLDRKNVKVVPSLEELTNLLNTLSSAATEQFIGNHRPKATSYFFEAENEETLYYKWSIRQRISSEFAQVLAQIPKGATHRSNGEVQILAPTFVDKRNQRVTWRSRIRVTAQAFRRVMERPPVLVPGSSLAGQLGSQTTQAITQVGSAFIAASTGLNPVLTGIGSVGASLVKLLGDAPGSGSVAPLPAGGGTIFEPEVLVDPLFRMEVAAQGYEVFEVAWSVSITTRGVFSNPRLEGILHIDTSWSGP